MLYLERNKKGSWIIFFWKKRSVFFDLLYWSSLDVRYCLDVIHVEKNVCDNLIGTLLNIKGKIKYTKKSHKYVMVMGIRQELSPKEIGNITYFSPACHTLSKKEKKLFANVRGVSMFPTGTHQM